MDIDTRWPMCNRLDEDGDHLSYKFKFAKAVWREVLMEDVREFLAAQPSAMEVLKQICQPESEIMLKMTVVI
jgi:hypothetical protein